jgi:hypothetical protein
MILEETRLRPPGGGAVAGKVALAGEGALRDVR